MRFKLLLFLSVFASSSLVACGGTDTPPAETPPAPTATTSTPAAAPQQSASTATRVNPGAVVYKKCKVCHTLKEGERHKVGPNLYGIMGADAAQKEGFNYSKAMKVWGQSWTEENLDGYLERPNRFMPGNRMTFIGLKKPEDRAAVIAYLKTETAPQ